MYSSRYIISLKKAIDFPEVVGGKASGLSKLINHHLPVPDGFVVSSLVFQDIFCSALGELDQSLSQVDINDQEELERSCALARQQVCALFSSSLFDEIKRYLSDNFLPGEGFAVRSSCIGEDGELHSFAGEHDTYLWVVGFESILSAIKNCWSSVFNERAVIYRRQRDLPVSFMAVLVQKMVDAKSSGVMMTLNPQNGDQSTITIESIWGLGELLVSGQSTPDRFLLNKITGLVVSKEIAKKIVLLKRNADDGVTQESVEDELQEVASLSREQLDALLSVAKLAEKCIGNRFLDIEFAFDDELRILQVRPETYWSNKNNKNTSDVCASAMQLILHTLKNKVEAV